MPPWPFSLRTVPEAIGPTLPTACHSGLDMCYLMWYPNGQGPFTPHLHLAFPPAEMCIHEVIKSAGSWRGILGERYSDTREGGHYHAAEAGEGCYVFAGIRAAIGLEALLYISIPPSQAVAMAQA